MLTRPSGGNERRVLLVAETSTPYAVGKRQYFDNIWLMILLDFVAANICVYFQYLFMPFVCANIFGAIVLKPGFKIDDCSSSYMKYCYYY